jgi:hypothetical protein
MPDIVNRPGIEPISFTAELEVTEEFSQWGQGRRNCCGQAATLISVLVLAVLRYLGRAWT